MGHRETSWATNGREALTLLKGIPADLIISASSMPEMDGMELLMACKEDPGLKHTPFVMVGDVHEQGTPAMKAGADAYLVKPFAPEELQEILSKVKPPGH